MLSGPDEKDMPHQGSKVFLQENGHIISTFEFCKEGGDINVELEIRQASQGTLPGDVEFEIVYSVHTTAAEADIGTKTVFDWCNN